MFGLIKLSDDEKVIIAQALAFSHYTFNRRGNSRQAQQQLRANAKIAQKLGVDIPTLEQGKLAVICGILCGSLWRNPWTYSASCAGECKAKL